MSKMDLTPAVIDIRRWAMDNEKFRVIVYTNKHSRLTIMSLNPGQSIGVEKHTVDQLITIVEGDGKAIFNSKIIDITDGNVISIPAGTVHNITNTSDVLAMKLYSVYSSSDLKGV